MRSRPVSRRSSTASRAARRRFVGVFAQDLIEVTPKLQLTLSARVDSWRNYDAHNLETTLATGLPTAAQPRFAAGQVGHGSQPARRGFVSRHRPGERLGQRQQGIPRADAQGALQPVPRRPGAHARQRDAGPERLTGVEGGVSVAPTDGLTVRGTLFNNRVKDPIANVTTDRHAGLITRQLQESRQHEHRRIPDRCGVSRQCASAACRARTSSISPRSTSRSADAAGIDLTGKYLAEVPKHRASFQVKFTPPEIRERVAREPVRRPCSSTTT